MPPSPFYVLNLGRFSVVLFLLYDFSYLSFFLSFFFFLSIFYTFGAALTRVPTRSRYLTDSDSGFSVGTAYCIHTLLLVEEGIASIISLFLLVAIFHIIPSHTCQHAASAHSAWIDLVMWNWCPHDFCHHSSSSPFILSTSQDDDQALP